MRACVGFAIHGAALVGAGAAGAAIALGVAAAAGSLGSSSTTVREVLDTAPSQSPSAASFASASKPLTIHDVYARDAPGVVQVTATSRVAVQTNPFLDPFGFGGSTAETQEALGSGFVIDKAGHIVTNYHVVEGAQRVQVAFRTTSASLRDRRRPRSGHRYRRPAGEGPVARADAVARSATPTSCASATPSSRSAIRSARTARSRPAS